MHILEMPMENVKRMQSGPYKGQIYFRLLSPQGYVSYPWPEWALVQLHDPSGIATREVRESDL
jgi:hypothetical protein